MELESYLHAVREASASWAKSKGHLVYLEHYRRALIAILMKGSSEKSAAAQEREALASQEYLDFLEGLSAAVEDEANRHWALKRAEMKVELWRTQQANQRMERKAYNA